MLAERYGGKIAAFATLSPWARFRAIEGAPALLTVSRPLDMLASYRIAPDAATCKLVLENKHLGPASAARQLEDVIRERAGINLLRCDVTEFQKLLLGKHIEEMLQTVDFKDKSDVENAAFLAAVESKLGLISHLCLRNHRTLLTTRMKAWSEDAMQRLTRVNLSGCEGVHQGGLLHLAEKAANLRFLDISHNRTLGSMSGYLIGRGGRLLAGERRIHGAPLRFGRLEYLDASGCSAVR